MKFYHTAVNRQKAPRKAIRAGLPSCYAVTLAMTAWAFLKPCTPVFDAFLQAGLYELKHVAAVPR